MEWYRIILPNICTYEVKQTKYVDGNDYFSTYQALGIYSRAVLYSKRIFFGLEIKTDVSLAVYTVYIHIAFAGKDE